MPGAFTTKIMKDGDGRPVLMRMWDESGTGLGPFSFGQVITDGALGFSIPTKDAGPSWTTVWGAAGVPVASGDATGGVMVTDIPTVGQKLCIDDLIVSVDTQMSVTFKEQDTGTIMFGPWYLAANSGPLQLTPRGKKKLLTVNKKLQLFTSAVGNITVQAGYHSEV